MYTGCYTFSPGTAPLVTPITGDVQSKETPRDAVQRHMNRIGNMQTEDHEIKFLRAIDLRLPTADDPGGRIAHTFEYICVATGDMYLDSWMGDSGP